MEINNVKIWVISDTHFNHKKLITADHRPANFNELIVYRWNKQVQEHDITIHLGDVILGQDSELPTFLHRIKGKKILCKGNHDNKPITWYLERGFDFVCDYFVHKNIAFSHAPLTPLPNQGLDNYTKMVDLNIHGHFHNNGHRTKEGHEDEYFNLTYYNSHKSNYHLIQIEDTFRPVLLDNILKI